GARQPADVVQQVPALQAQVMAAASSPADLAPASAADHGLVVMISGRELLTVDVGGLSCARPLEPAVFERRVYVPCGGEGRVLVLDERGATAAPDIVVPGGGDPVLVVDDGRLVVHDPDDGRIVLVQQDGSTQVTDLGGAEVPTVEPGDEHRPRPPISVSGPSTPVTPPTQDPIQVQQPDPPSVDPGATPSGGSTPDATDRPTGAGEQPGGGEPTAPAT